MSLNPEHVSAAKAQKKSVGGIHAHSDAKRMLSVLTSLGLCTPELSASLEKLAAAGGDVSALYKVSVWDLDRALNEVWCSVSDRIAFKASLSRAGLLSVPK